MIYNKIFVAGANGMLGTTLQKHIDLSKFLLTDKELGDNIIYCEVLPDRASLSNFYTWKETPPGTTPTREVWRPFLWVVSPEGNDTWGVNSLMSSISLSETQSVYSLLSQITSSSQT
jgi:hypothetical protein